MSRDRSLEEFLGGASEGSAASGSDGEGSETEPEPDADVVSESDPEADSEPDCEADSESDPDSDSEAGNREPGADTGDAPTDSSDDVEPATVTYRWDPGGAGCAECGAPVEQLWSGESGQVCAECKEW